MTEIEEIVALLKSRMLGQTDGAIIMVGYEHAAALIEALDLKERELETISASHKDLAHRVARMGEALREIALLPHGSSANDVSSCLNNIKWIARTAINGYPSSGEDAALRAL